MIIQNFSIIIIEIKNSLRRDKVSNLFLYSNKLNIDYSFYKKAYIFAFIEIMQI